MGLTVSDLPHGDARTLHSVSGGTGDGCGDTRWQCGVVEAAPLLAGWMGAEWRDGTMLK